MRTGGRFSRERNEHRQRDDLLQNLQLGQAQRRVPEAIRRHLQQILEKRDAPTQHGSDVPLLIIPVPQMRVLGERHERVREDQQQCGS